MDAQLLQIFILIAGAAAIPFLSRRFRIPSAACEIVLGIVLFNTVISHTPEWFALLKELGFIYLMFIAGMELNLRALLDKRRNLLWYTLLPAASFLLTPLLFMLVGLPPFAGVALAVVSEAIVLPVLKESGTKKSVLGQHILNLAVTGEILSIAVLTGIDLFHKFGLTPMAGFQMLKLLALLLAAAAFLKVLYLAAWWNPEWVERVMESDDPVEEGIRAVIAVAFAGALLAHFAGVEAILGSFMAGAVFRYVFKSTGFFEEKINAVGFGFFTPFFFIGVGAGFDISLLGSISSIVFSLLLTVLLFAGKGLPIVFPGALKISRRQGLGMSLLLSCPLSMIVVAGALGVKMGLLTPDFNSLLILTGLFASLIFPALFRAVSRKE